MKKDIIAQMCHEVNRIYCQILGDDSQVPWDEAPSWQKDSVKIGVTYHQEENHQALPSHSHESWMKEKQRTGWKYGPVKDEKKKEHPCFLPYESLPDDQKIKDELFIAIVRILS